MNEKVELVVTTILALVATVIVARGLIDAVSRQAVRRLHELTKRTENLEAVSLDAAEQQQRLAEKVAFTENLLVDSAKLPQREVSKPSDRLNQTR